MAQPGPAQGGFIPPNMKPCAQCNRAIDPTRAVYSNAGELVCDVCAANSGLDERISRAAKGLTIGTVVVACLSWVCNPFFVFSIIAIGNAVGALRLLFRQDVKEALGSTHSTMMVVSILGLVIAGARVLVDLGGIALVMLAR